MRQIKFRLWHEATKTMFYNVDVNCDGSTKVWDERGDNFQWITGVLEQYTGLNDKTGKDIYESDVVQTIASDKRRLSKFIVVWHKGGAGFRLKRKDDGELFTFPYLINDKEVIGNIHEEKSCE